MSPVRTGLAILLVSLLLGSFVLSLGSTLFAQESPATPTVIPFDQLPICPTQPADFTPMPADDSLPATCRAEVRMDTDVKALIEQGIDPATLGIGDPRDLDPEQFETPTPAAAADAPNQTNKLYLPMMNGGQSSPE